MISILIMCFFSITLVVGLVKIGAYLLFESQKVHDANRKGYAVVFPSNMSEEQVKDWVRSCSGSLPNGLGRLTGVRSIVFELHGKDHGLRHQIRLPTGVAAEYMVAQLRSSIPGINVTPIEIPSVGYSFGVDITMNDGARTLRIANGKDYSNRILSAAGPVSEGEQITLQWVVVHSARSKIPPSDRPVRTSQNSVWQALSGNLQASPDEVTDRRIKNSEQVFSVMGRIGSVASSDERAKELVTKILNALKSENDGHAYFIAKKTNMRKFNESINTGKTPVIFGASFTVSELTALLGWPINQPFVAGLPMGLSRQLPASISISSDGLPIGISNFPGAERDLAITPLNARRHIWVPGVSGVGKTTWLTNLAYEAMVRGLGVIIFDGKKDIAEATLNHVPPHRKDDVIYLDFMDTEHAIGFNPLDQGRSSAVIDEVISLISHLYPDVGKGVYARYLLHYGLHALEEARQTTGQQYSLLDLMTLLNPQFPSEKAWSAEIKAGLKDRALKRFFDEWDHKVKEEVRLTRLNPLETKYWQFDRPELRNVIGQTKSAFQMQDVIMGNKILIVNLVGMNDNSRELAAVLLMNSLWGAVRSNTPEKENLLILDEFADFMKIPVDFESMLAKARSAKLGMVLANQEMKQLTPEMYSALSANALTKVVFQLGSDDARKMADQFSANGLTKDDLSSLPAYHAIARISTDAGVSPAVSLVTRPEFPRTGSAPYVVAKARGAGRTSDAVEREMDLRRTPTSPVPKANRRINPPGRSTYNPPNSRNNEGGADHV